MNKTVGCWFPLKVECRLSLRLENTEKNWPSQICQNYRGEREKEWKRMRTQLVPKTWKTDCSMNKEAPRYRSISGVHIRFKSTTNRKINLWQCRVGNESPFCQLSIVLKLTWWWTCYPTSDQVVVVVVCLCGSGKAIHVSRTHPNKLTSAWIMSTLTSAEVGAGSECSHL